MNRRQFEAHLRSHGCFLYRNGAKHDVWINPANGEKAMIPRHRTVKKPLALGVCRKLDVPPPDGM